MTAAPKAGTDWLRRNVRKIGEGAELAVTQEVASSVEVEAWLKRRNVQYAPPTGIPMALIDERRSRGNQARRDPLVAESVERFATAFRQNNIFPPIVVYPLGGKLIIIDGNNRQAAAKKAGREHIQGIIISDTTPSEVIQLLTVEANAHHGVTPELSWRLKQAFHLIGLGFSDQEAAEACGVTTGQVRNARATQQCEERARQLRIHNFAAVSTTTKQLLNVLKDEAVFYQACLVTVNHDLGVEDVRDLLREIKKQPSEADRIRVIAEIAKAKTVEQATKKAMNSRKVSAPKHSLVAGMGLIMNCDESSLTRNILTEHDRSEVRKRLDEAVDKILSIQIALDEMKLESQ